MSFNLDFKPISIKDKEIIQPIVFQSPYQICNFSFANLIIWGTFYSPQYAIFDKMLIIKTESDKTYYNFPIGNGNKKMVIEHLINVEKSKNQPFIMTNVTEEMKNEIEYLFPNTFHFSSSRDFSDYLYLREHLETLAGKKLQPKRNHIHQFEKMYQYTYKRIENEDIEPCVEMLKLWAKENDCGEENCTLKQETCAAHHALTHFKDLDMTGGLLKVDNQIVAFTLGCPINKNTFDVNIEKALKNVHGAYTMINKLFVENELSDFTYINREEDLGKEGLRKAKLSYHPYTLLEKYNAETL